MIHFRKIFQRLEYEISSVWRYDAFVLNVTDDLGFILR